MDYLKSHVTASASALAMICKCLAEMSHPLETAELHRTLRPHIPSSAGGKAEGNALESSLAVGQDIELLEAQPDAHGRKSWAVAKSLREEIRADRTLGSEAVRALVLQYIGRRAVAAVTAGEKPADLALALSWFARIDPLAPISEKWGDGPEAATLKVWGASKEDRPIGSGEQWRSFRRWARALGLTQTVGLPGKTLLIADPTRAILRVLPLMPRRAAADAWFRHLMLLLPILGESPLATLLPESAFGQEIPPSVALAISKLERSGALALYTSDDSTDAVVLRFGERARRVGEVQILEDSA